MGHNHRDRLWDDQRLSRSSEEEAIFEEMSSRRSLFLLTAVCPLLLGKPQYGAAPPVQTPDTAPFVQTPSQISCITTQETIWDTQYIEKIEQECHQEQIQKFRQACRPSTRTPVRLLTNRCALSSTVRSRSLTQRQSAVASKRLIVSLVGRRTDTEARSGLRFQAHASRTHMTAVRMFRSKNWCRCPTLTARTCHNSNVQRFLNNSANRSPTPRHSRFAKTSTARSLKE